MDRLAEDFDFFRAVDDFSAERAFRLISDKNNAVAGIPEIVLQVMLDASCFTHPTGGNDDLRSGVVIERL